MRDISRQFAAGSFRPRAAAGRSPRSYLPAVALDRGARSAPSTYRGREVIITRSAIA